MYKSTQHRFFVSSKTSIVSLLMLLCLSASAQKRNVKKIKADKIILKEEVLYGQASFYGDKFNGRKTASGEIFSQNKLTAACNKLPLGTWIKVTNIKNGDTVIVKVNDRLHPKMKRVVDLSKAAAKKIGLTTQGVTRVKVEVME